MINSSVFPLIADGLVANGMESNRQGRTATAEATRPHSLSKAADPLKNPASSRRWLWLGVLLSNLLVATVAAFALSHSREQYRERAYVTVDNLSKVLEQTVVATIEKIDTALLSVVDEIDREKSAGSIDGQVLDAFLTRVLGRLHETHGLRVANAEGLVDHAVGEVRIRDARIADFDPFIRLRDDAKAGLIISGPSLGRTSGKWTIVPARRLNAPQDAFAGIVFAPIPVDYLEELISSIDLGPHGVVIMFNRALSVVARHPDAGQSGSTIGSGALSPEVRALIISGQQAARYEARSRLNGVKRTYFYRQVGSYPLYFSVGMADEDYLATWWREVLGVSGLVILVGLVSVVASWLVGRRWKERANAVQELQASEDRYRGLFTHMQAGFTLREIVTADAEQPVDYRFLAANQAFLDIYGLRSEDVVGKTLIEVFPDSPKDTIDWIAIYGEVALTGKPAHFEAFSEVSQRWTEVTAYRTAPMQFAVLVTDITERKQAEQTIQELAYFDSLTKLPNRRLLMDRLGQAVIASVRSKQEGGLLIIDLDDFKTLNDTFGHAQGDQLLQQVARRLSTSVREGDTVAHLEGDEFVVVLENLGDNSHEAAARIRMIAEKILAILCQPYVLSSQEHHGTASIGAALFGEHRESMDDLIKRAGIALCQAKAAGRNTLRFFDPDLQAAVKTRATLEEDLRQGIKSSQFLLYYQPQVDRGILIGAEALARWKHPERGMVSPGEFIPLAEETGLILPLGQWVLETACRQIARWAGRKETRHINLAVNVSARQFRQPDFVEQVLAVLDRTRANPQNLKLELTESMLLDNVEDVIGKMTALRSHGLSFSLDDFGTGYSSLSYLKRLPLDQLKIDQSFVKDVLADLNNGAIAQTIITLGKTMGLAVIAEGVETEEQRDFLARLGCSAFQGYLFSRPLPLEELQLLVGDLADDSAVVRQHEAAVA
jgi:diguanylate cyclase (GGDEF)-like protein/PAS domain S-box-containing protein